MTVTFSMSPSIEVLPEQVAPGFAPNKVLDFFSLGTMSDASTLPHQNLALKPGLTQQTQLPNTFNNYTVLVSDYSNSYQRMSFEPSRKSVVNTKQTSSDDSSSRYDRELTQFLNSVSKSHLLVHYHKPESSFILSSSTEPDVRISVPSQIRTEGLPNRLLKGFLLLHESNLSVLNQAWSCYQSMGHILRSYTVASCFGEGMLSWGDREGMYVYEPSDIVKPLVLTTSLNSYSGWALSDDYSIHINNDNTVTFESVATLVSSFEEPVDAGGADDRTTDKTTSSNQQQSSSNNSGDNAPNKHKKKSRPGKSSGNAGDGDDPNDRRPSDYKQTPPEDGTVQNAKVSIFKLKKQQEDLESKINSKRETVKQKYSKAATFDARKREQIVAEIKELETRYDLLSGQIKEMESRQQAMKPGDYVRSPAQRKLDAKIHERQVYEMKKSKR